MNGTGHGTEAAEAAREGRSLLRRLCAFYFPLAVQGISMSLTYPLVGSVVAHGPLGAAEYALLAQAQAIMFLVGSVGNGLVSTGMIFTKTKRGLRNFAVLSLSLGAGAVALQALCCLPPFDGVVFGRLYRLEGESFRLARSMLLFSIPMNFAFFVRNTGLASLFREKRTDKATFATFFRIGLTWACSIAFVKLGWVGWKWGLGLTTAAVWIETALVNALSVPYSRRLPEDGAEPVSIGRQYAFTIPLSLGGMMLCLSGTAVPAFLALTPDPLLSRNVHYIAFGILTPLSVAAARMQSVSIAFPPGEHRPGAVFAFALGVGAFLSALSLLLQVPSVAAWYFGGVQNLAAGEIPLAREAMLVVGAIPLVVAAKGYGEGRAAVAMRPNAILASQIAYLAAQMGVFFALVQLRPVAGHLMSAVSILAAQLFSLAVLRVALHANRIADDFGVAHAAPGHGR